MKKFRVWFIDGTYTVVTGRSWEAASRKLEFPILEITSIQEFA